MCERKNGCKVDGGLWKPWRFIYHFNFNKLVFIFKWRKGKYHFNILFVKVAREKCCSEIPFVDIAKTKFHFSILFAEIVKEECCFGIAKHNSVFRFHLLKSQNTNTVF